MNRRKRRSFTAEQARGDIDQIDERTDVYALGAVLYQLLSGERPFADADSVTVIAQVLQAPPTAPHPLPQELVDACVRAMALSQFDRHQTAGELSGDIESWLDGARRRDQALLVTQQAQQAATEAITLAERAASLRGEGAELLADIPTWAPEEQKWPGWAKWEQAAEVQHESLLASLRQEHLLNAALTHAPDLLEAHAELAARELVAHRQAEAARDRKGTAEHELQLRLHAGALPKGHPLSIQSAEWLAGMGSLTLVTTPPGAEVTLHRFEERNRRLMAEPVRSLGITPLHSVPLPIGSYACVIRHPDRAPVTYPVHIGRREHWDGVSPDGEHPTPIGLPELGELGPEDCYVPGGLVRRRRA